ncbi:MAG TPA: hypothetical protein VFC78_17335 [Tepidisphaeraceae bacterium]|nr:hypothetical protein [Tepidisphaeraceae bacterium]
MQFHCLGNAADIDEMFLPGSSLSRLLIAVGPVAAALVFAALAPGAAGRAARGLERVLWRSARSRALAPLIAALVSLILSVAPILVSGQMPQPAMHDEFSYLLAADTYAHGRLTNPPLPWPVAVHLETFHVIQRPTYMSKYMPGQGMALALGQVMTGKPIVGVWISLAFACGAVAWMLLAWVPPRWAMMGGIMAACLPTVVAWGHDYWGGAVAMAGGALVLGAFRRIVRGPTLAMSVTMGLGIALLAVSRPYEGALLAAVCGVGLIVWILQLKSVPKLAASAAKSGGEPRMDTNEHEWEKRHSVGAGSPRALGMFRNSEFGIRNSSPNHPKAIAIVLIPLAISMACLACFLGYYNWRVTGSATRMPYAVHEQQYGATPLFLFQRPKPMPVYRHKELREFQEYVLQHNYYEERAHYGAEAKRRVIALLTSFIQPRAVIFPLLFLPLVLRRDRWMLTAIVAGALVTAATFLSTWLFMHYLAPVFCIIALLIVQGMRQMRQARLGRYNVGRLAVLAVFLSCAWPAGKAFAKYAKHKDEGLADRRAQGLAALQTQPGKQLVFVHYDYTGGFEWVYNEADVDNAKVVWARQMTPRQDQELIGYFKDRNTWIINGNEAHPQLRPYAPMVRVPPRAAELGAQHGVGKEKRVSSPVNGAKPAQ